MTEPENSRIPEMIREGKDQEVMKLLYRKVLPQVKSFITRNGGNRDDAGDIFHDALMLFYRQVMEGSFDSKYNVYGYLYRIAVFRWINRARKDKPLVWKEELPEDVAMVWENYERPGGKTEQQILSDLFSPIGEKCMELLNLTVFTDMLMEDVMVRLGYRTPEAVRMQHMRCKQKLLKEIEKNPEILNKLKGI